MINLLPQHHQDLLRAKYNARRITIASYFVVILSIISLSFFASGYFLTENILSNTNLQNNTNSLKTIDGETLSSEVIATTLSDLARASRLADELDSKLRPSGVYKIIRNLEGKPNSVHLYEIGYSNKLTKEGVVETLILKGVAENRDSLTSLGRFLESIPDFQSVDLPISNFAKERDIDFSLIATLK